MAPTRLTVCAHGRCSVFMETWTSRVLEVCGKACNAEPSPNARACGRTEKSAINQRYRAVYDVSTNDMCCVYPVRTCAVRPTLSIVTKRLTATALCRASAINRNTRLSGVQLYHAACDAPWYSSLSCMYSCKCNTDTTSRHLRTYHDGLTAARNFSNEDR